MKNFLAISAFLLLLGAGCVSNKLTPPARSSTTITYYLSPNIGDKTKFCNGADMDSAGYKNSLTNKITKEVLGNLTLEQKIIKTLELAAADTEFGEEYTRVASTTYNNGVVTMHPASGWAGVSIFMCNYQPFVEKQLEQFSEVKKIEWQPVSN